MQGRERGRKRERKRGMRWRKRKKRQMEKGRRGRITTNRKRRKVLQAGAKGTAACTQPACTPSVQKEE
jgi:hypothetical protein